MIAFKFDHVFGDFFLLELLDGGKAKCLALRVSGLGHLICVMGFN